MTRRRRWPLLAAAAALVAGALVARPRSVAPARIAAGPAPSVGQWVWTRADADLFAEVRRGHPGLGAAVLAGTIVAEGERLELRRGLSPVLGGAPGPVAIVVRLDDSIHPLWARRSPAEITLAVGPLLARILDDARAAGATVTELQLDYDAPERRLEAWAGVVAGLGNRELAGVPLWVTSVPSHLDDPRFGARLAGHVEGHILQLFDTGLRRGPGEEVRIREALARQGLPFRLGVAAYERQRGARTTTSHGAWVESVATLRELPGYAGVWVFPAGREYGAQLALLEGER
jgi:hypothetical protein